MGDMSKRNCCWYEEEIEQNLRWCFALNSILHTGSSQYQDIALLDTKPFGKVLVLDGKLQSAEMDEFIYHESLVHPALLHHPNPKNVFIMGGGEGSTAREILRHCTVEMVTMCDIDEASESPLDLDAEKFDVRIRQRIEGENRYLDGKTFASASILSKAVRKSLAKETQLYTEGSAKFIYGHGNCNDTRA